MPRYTPVFVVIVLLLIGSAPGAEEEPPPVDDNPYDRSVEPTEPGDASPEEPVDEPEEISPPAPDADEKEADRVERLDEEAERRAPSVHVVVWIGAASEEMVGYRYFSEALVGAGFSLVLETVENTPTAAEALEIMLSYRAAAVVWHDAEDALQVFFREVGRPEMITTESGDPKEEALYLKELLLTRTGQDSLLSSYLVTVPEEIIEAEKPAPKPAPEVKASPPKGPELETVARPEPPKKPISRNGWKVGIGYILRAHSDTTLWWQSGLRLHVPIMRMNDLVESGISVTVGFPSEVGEEGVQWLEMRSFEGVASVGVVPLRMEKFEIFGRFGLGIASMAAVAFLSSGETESHQHMTGIGTMSMGAIWYPFPPVGVRLYFEGTYVFAPPSYSINGNGEFGEYPWIPGGGLDIVVSLFRS